MKAYAATDIGRIRISNQDFVYKEVHPVGKLPNLFVVADGMGGHKAGEVASKTAVETVVKSVKTSRKNDIIYILQKAVNDANAVVKELASTDSQYEGMGTTLVIATIVENMIYIANVGDSRLYFIDDDIHQITRDHSYVEDLVSLGKIDKDEARTHVKKNIITRAVGIDDDVDADYFEVQYESGDKILMCSDGLTNMTEDVTIKTIVNGDGTIEEKTKKLVDTANQNGGKDNITVVLIEL